MQQQSRYLAHQQLHFLPPLHSLAITKWICCTSSAIKYTLFGLNGPNHKLTSPDVWVYPLLGYNVDGTDTIQFEENVCRSIDC